MTDLKPGSGTRDRMFIGSEVYLIVWLSASADLFACDFFLLPSWYKLKQDREGAPAALGVPQ